jgi:methylated-DNA-[protein]-cysteine S-methyltransferase
VGAIVVGERGDDAARDHLRRALGELAEFFASQRRAFTVALDPHGSAFRSRAWAAVAAVPYGETRTYTDIARTITVPLAVRAVGAANGANPIAPFIPCHRIVGGDGRLTGYGPGLPLKQRLLAMEGAIPYSEADYPAWVERVSVRTGSADWVLGVRATGTYCQPCNLHSLHYRLLPNRIFANAGDASAAGFTSCSACYPRRL